ncbi:hypothetical protein L6Q21_12235 [Sandaracinobacter sp. RS1-74]|uniref:hypothetical protein n=1 Tax=Sandaracinobacteroides sayramensis TaxID=2913411 RepID=UPI001EDBA912|nr:hypothetical protein [Sandaracinobacteroides sayramensis]MCG2841751.1 hypothetical protein [Sandaracinobacteroides sayramensis]
MISATQAETSEAAGPAVSEVPALTSAEDAREIAEDSARDLKDSRFYNRPGATRADYDADWQECRLIARGSRTMGGQTVVVPYNPGIISPAAAAGAGIIGAMIGNAIAEGELRRANRRTCLLVKGWNLVEVEDAAVRSRVAAMTDAEREGHFERLVGAETLPEGVKVTRWANRLAAPAIAAPLEPRTPPKASAPPPKPVKPVEIAPGQGGVILGFRRPDSLSQGKSAAVLISRYDPEAANIVTPARRDKADTTTYSALLKSRDKALELEHVAAALTPGTYVITGATPAAQGVVNVNFCLGSAMFTVEPGKLTYIGDFIPHPFVKVEGGLQVPAMTWENHPADAEAGAPKLLRGGEFPVAPASFTNGVSWGCAASTMAAYAIPGAPALEGPRRAGPARAVPASGPIIVTVPTS